MIHVQTTFELRTTEVLVHVQAALAKGTDSSAAAQDLFTANCAAISATRAAYTAQETLVAQRLLDLTEELIDKRSVL